MKNIKNLSIDVKPEYTSNDFEFLTQLKDFDVNDSYIFNGKTDLLSPFKNKN